jgi:hypothetical protein
MGDDYYKIMAKHSGKYLDVYGRGNENGEYVCQWEWANQNNAKWKIETDFPHIWDDFPLDISYVARVYVIYFVPHANSLDKSSLCTRRPKPLLDKKLQIQR